LLSGRIQVGAAVAGDQLGQLPFVAGFDQFVNQFAGEGIADSIAGLSGQGPSENLDRTTGASLVRPLRLH
jgi:hypothetical protein